MISRWGNGLGLQLYPNANFYDQQTSLATTLNAVGESVGAVGRIRLTSGRGTSKTLNNTSKVHIRFGSTLTWADPTTVLRVGLQGVSAGGIEDGVWQVYVDLVPGVNAISGGTNMYTFTTGSATVTDGLEYALVIEMTARGGTDSVQIQRNDVATIYPMTTIDVGTGVFRFSGGVNIAIEFADGEVGWFSPHFPTTSTIGANFSDSTTPDERALILTMPFRAVAQSLYARVTNIATPDDLELILYSDPLGTPVAERTAVFDASFIGDTAGWIELPIDEFTMKKGQTYAVAIRPTTSNSIALYTLFFGTDGANLRKVTQLGTDWYYAERTNQSGAFGSAELNSLPQMGLYITFDDGRGGGRAGVGLGV